MRASLIGRFLLLALASLVLLLPLWYWAREWFAAPPLWLAGSLLKALFGWVEGFEIEGASATLLTKVQVLMPGPDGRAQLAELTPEINYAIYGYGQVLLWAMLLASRPRWWPLKMVLGSVLLLPAQVWGLCFQWRRDVVVVSGGNAMVYLGYPSWINEVIAYGYQFGFLMLAPVAPILLWLLFDRSFVAALWLEVALDDGKLPPKPSHAPQAR